MQTPLYPCPACGFLMFTEPPGSYEICSICGWEDDHVQLAYPALRVGANNGASLLTWQNDILTKLLVNIQEHSGCKRDPNWRPLTEEDLINQEDVPGTGIQYFFAAAELEPPYYWQKKSS
jgi:hypothetical protein